MEVYPDVQRNLYKIVLNEEEARTLVKGLYPYRGLMDSRPVFTEEDCSILRCLSEKLDTILFYCGKKWSEEYIEKIKSKREDALVLNSIKAIE